MKKNMILEDILKKSYSLDYKTVLEKLNTDTKKGLTDNKIQENKKKFGRNTIVFKNKTPAWVLFLNEFKSPLVIILLIASLISYTISHEAIESLLILIIVVFNAFFGFFQNYKAEKSIEELKKYMINKTRVLRNGKIVEVDSKDLTVGDIVYVEEGDKVPADLRIISSSNLYVDESMLTGESEPKHKENVVLEENVPLSERKNILYMNTFVVKGNGYGVVIGIGENTEFGKIAKKLKETKTEKTKFQEELNDLGKKITYIIAAIILLVFMVNLYDGLSLIEVFMIAISLSVAAIPEGLPAIVTLSLALGTKKMLKKNILVRKLPVIETLGSVDIICTDKTGTLTENKMSVQFIYNYKNRKTYTLKNIKSEDMQEILENMFYCNNSRIYKNINEYIGDPTEIALKTITLDLIKNKNKKRVDEIPFNSERKMMSVIVKDSDKNQYILYSKGAPEKILNLCTLSETQKNELTKIYEQYSKKGLRVLAFAYKVLEKPNVRINDKDTSIERDLNFLGFVALVDPPRKEVKKAIEISQKAGIEVKMITGDNVLTAKYIANEIGINGKSMDCSYFDKLDLNKEEDKEKFRNIVLSTSIFARATPEHKYNILKILKEENFTVAMTGDGVNDAPALKKADVGIAMGIRGTEITKQVADIVILDDNFKTIVDAVEQGRTIFINIRKFVNYLLSANIAEVLIVLLASLNNLIALKPVQLLWINLLTDGLPALALGNDKTPKGIMNKKLKQKNEKIINSKPLKDIIINGVLLSLILYLLFMNYATTDLIKAQTVVFTSLVFFEFVRVLIVRKDSNIDLFSNKWLWISLIVSVALQLIIIYTSLNRYFEIVPLSLKDLLLIILAAFIYYILNIIIHFFTNKEK